MATQSRIEAAIQAGDSLDVLPTLHAGLTQPAVVTRFGLETG